MINSLASSLPDSAEPLSYERFDFRSMAERARLESAARRSDAAARLLAETQDWERRFRIAVDFLAVNVEPMLADAATAFRNEGIPVEISGNLTGGPILPALVAFQCCGTPKRGEGGGRTVGGVKILFAHDGEQFRAGIAKSYSNYAEHWRPCEPGEPVARLIGQSLETYFHAVERRTR